MRHDPGLDASPPVPYILEVERSGYSSFHIPRPLWTDNLLAKRRRTAVPSAQEDLLWGELLRRQDCLEPQLGAGATLCWIVTLSIAQRGEYEDTFEDPQIVAKWALLRQSLYLA